MDKVRIRANASNCFVVEVMRNFQWKFYTSVKKLEKATRVKEHLESKIKSGE